MKETELYRLGSGENTDYCTVFPALLLTTCEDFALFQVQFLMELTKTASCLVVKDGGLKTDELGLCLLAV